MGLFVDVAHDLLLRVLWWGGDPVRPVDVEWYLVEGWSRSAASSMCVRVVGLLSAQSCSVLALSSACACLAVCLQAVRRAACRRVFMSWMPKPPKSCGKCMSVLSVCVLGELRSVEMVVWRLSSQRFATWSESGAARILCTGTLL